MKDFKDLIDALGNVQSLETVEQKEIRLKNLKREILQLEIAVIAIGLIGLFLIVLPFFGILPFNLISFLVILGGIGLIIKAFKEGDTLETEKYFLLISISNDKKQKEDGK